jgi:glycosyltransferase involved in cell wall biosynthesis
MNILIYAHAFAPSIGGVEKYVMLLAEGLATKSADLRVTIATPTPAGDFEDARLPFRVVRQPNFQMLWRLIGQADMVQLAGPVFLPLLLCLLRRKFVAIEHHGYQAVCPNGLLLYEPTKTVCPGHFMARRYHKCVQCNAGNVGMAKSVLLLLLTFPRCWLCHFAAVNIPVTRHVLRRLRIPRSQVIYHGIVDPFQGSDGIAKTSAVPQPLCFAYVGRLTSEKGLPLLVRAAHRLRNRGYSFRVWFIGDGPERTHLEGLTTELDVQDIVTFTGFLTGDRLQQALDAVAVVVMPSTWEETAGLSAMEQMMRGRVVIAADIGGLGEVVNGAGLTFTMGDVAQLAACMQQVLDTPGMVQSLGQQARARAVQQFRQARMVDEHLALYTDLQSSG